VCSFTPYGQEHYFIWPIAAQVAIGTIFFIAILVMVAIARIRLRLYARLLIWMLLALLPSALFVIPYETLRKEIMSKDPSLITDPRVPRVLDAYVYLFTHTTFTHLASDQDRTGTDACSKHLWSRLLYVFK
jgi:hypothetical protein